MEHVTSEQAVKLASGRLDAAEWWQVARHLLTGCRLCRERLSALGIEERCGLAPVDESAYDDVVSRVIARVTQREVPRWRQEKAQLDRLLAAARACPNGIAGLTGDAEKDLHGWPLVEALLQASYEARFRNPRKMLDLAAAAQVASQNLQEERYGPALVADLQARAWGELANAYRVNEDMGAAEHALAQADAIRDRGTGDPLILARLLDVEASLRNDQRRFSEAFEALDSVHRLYLEMGENHLAGRALISKGFQTAEVVRGQDASHLFRSGLALLEPERDPHLAAMSHYGLIYSLVECGDFLAANSLLQESGLRRAFASEPLILLRLRCLEGRILAGLGKLYRAEAVLQQVRDGFLGYGQEHEAALAELDLAAVWLRLEGTAEVQPLAKEVLAAFQDLGVHREAQRAAHYLHEACRRERATLALVQSVLDFLRRLEQQPQLRFHPR